jgi:eukaryotic-like serine/threonine-protein kinase
MAEGEQRSATLRSNFGPVPASVGKYRIDDIVGRGSIGIVYKAHEEGVDRPLAVKTLRPEILAQLSKNVGFLRRFVAEARLAIRCLHPNIVTVFDVVEQEGAPYVVMEYLAAGTLETVIRSGEPVPIRQVGELMTQLLLALDHAVSKGVIHGNIKPANILCPTASSIKLADFAMAYAETTSLATSDRLGPTETLGYMAPERLMGHPADARSDLFSAGVILFQLLSGVKPFAACDRPELLHKLMIEGAPSVLRYRPELGSEIAALTQRVLACKPEDRFPSADEFVDSLNRAINARPTDTLQPLDLARLSVDPRPAPLTANAGRLQKTLAEMLSPAAIDALGRSLADSLGPIARLLVKWAAQEATDIDMLLTTLAPQFRTKAEVERFRRDAELVLGGSRRVHDGTTGLDEPSYHGSIRPP